MKRENYINVNYTNLCRMIRDRLVESGSELMKLQYSEMCFAKNRIIYFDKICVIKRIVLEQKRHDLK